MSSLILIKYVQKFKNKKMPFKRFAAFDKAVHLEYYIQRLDSNLQNCLICWSSINSLLVFGLVFVCAAVLFEGLFLN